MRIYVYRKNSSHAPMFRTIFIMAVATWLTLSGCSQPPDSPQETASHAMSEDEKLEQQIVAGVKLHLNGSMECLDTDYERLPAEQVLSVGGDGPLAIGSALPNAHGGVMPSVERAAPKLAKLEQLGLVRTRVFKRGSADVNAFYAQILLTAEGEPDYRIRRGYYTEAVSFCYGDREFLSVENYSIGEYRGFPVAKVYYKYKINNIRAWARDFAASKTIEATVELKKTARGWISYDKLNNVGYSKPRSE